MKTHNVNKSQYKFGMSGLVKDTVLYTISVEDTKTYDVYKLYSQIADNKYESLDFNDAKVEKIIIRKGDINYMEGKKLRICGYFHEGEFLYAYYSTDIGKNKLLHGNGKPVNLTMKISNPESYEALISTGSDCIAVSKAIDDGQRHLLFEYTKCI